MLFSKALTFLWTVFIYQGPILWYNLPVKIVVSFIKFCLFGLWPVIIKKKNIDLYRNEKKHTRASQRSCCCRQDAFSEMFFYQCRISVSTVVEGGKGEGGGGHWRRNQFSIKGSRLKRMGPQHKSEQKQDSVPWGSKQMHVFHNHMYMLRLWRKNLRAEVKKNPRDTATGQEVI